MQRQQTKRLHGHELGEETTLVMGSIKDLLIERGHGDLLLSSKDTPIRQAAAAAADRASEINVARMEMQMPQTRITPKPQATLAERLTSRLFNKD